MIINTIINSKGKARAFACVLRAKYMCVCVCVYIYILFKCGVAQCPGILTKQKKIHIIVSCSWKQHMHILPSKPSSFFDCLNG